MKKQVEPASRNLDTQETYDKFIARDDPVVVGEYNSQISYGGPSPVSISN